MAVAYKTKESLSGQKTPLPMQYLGSKYRISSWIVNSVRSHFPDKDTFVDIMSGTGSVAHVAMMTGYAINTNDIQPYSYYVLKSMFGAERDNLRELAETIEAQCSERLLAGARSKRAKDFLREKQFRKSVNACNWESYSKFCEESQSIRGKAMGPYDLFSHYYSNTYFGIGQCLELDAIREIADTLEGDMKVHLIAATVSAMTYLVSSTTHLAQYLKPSSEATAHNLIQRRSLSMSAAVKQRLLNLSESPLNELFDVTNLDYKSALEGLDENGSYVIYADPPYFKEHYSRYYHLLDTMVLYDYPELTFNPRLNAVTTGRYRESRIVSDFGLKSKVESAFTELFKRSISKGADLALSYADTSLVKKEKLIELAHNCGYGHALQEQLLMHSGQGQSRNRVVTEYLFLFKAH